MRAALTDERTREAYRLTVRHSAYVAGGMRIATRRVWEERTTARYGRMMRAAEAAGNVEEAKEWEERAHRFRHARHQRRMDMLSAMRSAPKAVGAGVLTGTVVLTAAGIAIAFANENAADVLLPFEFAIGPRELGIHHRHRRLGGRETRRARLGLIALWNLGRQRQAAPHWALPGEASRRRRPDHPVDCGESVP
jgi:S-DNA-T family DNA segregation ATPase FtsK/SpoIIIE